MSTHTLVELHDLDLLADEMRDPESRGRLKKLGFDLDDSLVLEKARIRLVESMESGGISSGAAKTVAKTSRIRL